MPKRILTFEEACKFLGYTKSYMYKLTARNLIPFSKPLNKKIYFDRDELEAWALSKKNTVRTQQEIEFEQEQNSEQLDIAAATYISTH